jgi:hypothetical protein
MKNCNDGGDGADGALSLADAELLIRLAAKEVPKGADEPPFRVVSPTMLCECGLAKCVLEVLSRTRNDLSDLVASARTMHNMGCIAHGPRSREARAYDRLVRVATDALYALDGEAP